MKFQHVDHQVYQYLKQEVEFEVIKITLLTVKVTNSGAFNYSKKKSGIKEYFSQTIIHLIKKYIQLLNVLVNKMLKYKNKSNLKLSQSQMCFNKPHNQSAEMLQMEELHLVAQLPEKKTNVEMWNVQRFKLISMKPHDYLPCRTSKYDQSKVNVFFKLVFLNF